IEPSLSSRTWRIASSTDWVSGISTLCSSQYAASPDCGSKRRIFSVYSGIGSVSPFFRLPARDRHFRVAHLGLPAVHGDVDVLKPLVVVALREVGAELRSARLLSLQRGDHDRFGHIEHVSQLDRADYVLVEDRAAVVDRGVRRLFLQALDGVECLRESVG